MIQVIQRAVGVLALLAEEEPLSLQEMTWRTGLKKPTLCLILKSLVELGCARKEGNGFYATGPRLQELASKPRRRQTVQGAAEETVARLAEELREGTLAAIVHHGRRFTIAQATFRQALMVDGSLQARGDFFECATGRILLAFMTDEERAKVLARDGQPDAQVWPEAKGGRTLSACLAAIRRERRVVMSTAGGAVHFLAVPVDGPDGKTWLALGASVPTSRFAPPRRKEIIAALTRAAAEMNSHLALLGAGTMPGMAPTPPARKPHPRDATTTPKTQPRRKPR